MRRSPTKFLLPAFIAASLLLACPALAAEQKSETTPGEPCLYTKSHEVEIPLNAHTCPRLSDAADNREAVVLYVSGNRGYTWVRAQKRFWPTKAMQFKAVNDGEFWCLFRDEKQNERGEPPAAQAAPQLVVVVDSAAPVIRSFRVQPSAGGVIDVSWQAEDRSPLVAVRAAAVNEATAEIALPRNLNKAWAGSAQFILPKAGAWQVGIMLEDAAGNAATADGEVEATAPLAAQPRSAPAEQAIIAPMSGDSEAPLPPVDDQQREAIVEVRARERINILASRTLKIGYEWDRRHPPTRVGLWVTRDGGRQWQQVETTDKLTGAFCYRASEDGIYGFRMHRELDGKICDVPQRGQAPEREVIIDTMPPEVRWLSPLGDQAQDSAAPAGRGGKPPRASGEVNLKWQAADAAPPPVRARTGGPVAGTPGLTAEPVTLEYRLFAEEAWRPLAGPMANTGEFLWLLPADLNGRAEVRITVRDQAGHATAALLPLEIVAPRVAPLGVDSKVAAAEAARRARDEARRAYALATLARLQENWQTAEEQLLRATTLDPAGGRAWVDLGGVYLHAGRWQSAADVYRKAVELLPDNPNAAFGLAKALAARGDLNAAAKTLDELVQKTPADAEAWLLYGDVLYRGGNLERARQCWLKALGLGGGQQANLAALQKRLELKQ